MKCYQIIANKYLLCLLLFHTINCFTMENVDLNEADERINQQVEAIRDMLNEQLGINKHCCFRSLIGSIMSYYATSFLYQKQIYNKIDDIERCIQTCPKTHNSPAIIKNKIFLILSHSHWYVHYLVNACIQEEVKKFENITCSTLDQFLHPDFSKDTIGIKKLIYDKSRAIFINKSDINSPIKSWWHIIDTLYKDDPHYTILQTSTHETLPNTMIMSKNEKYIQIKDIDNNTIIWNTNNGTQTTSIKQNVQWLSNSPLINECCVIYGRNYLAMAIEKSNGIILFKYPTLESHLCQKLFNENRINLEQLKILNTSKTLDTIKGFPGKNIKQNIDQTIKTLQLQNSNCSSLTLY